MQKSIFLAPMATQQHANSRMLNRYMPWVEYMLTVTLGKAHDFALEPTYEQALSQLRHLGMTLNGAVWGNKTRYNDKCQIVYIPVIEGAHAEHQRIHAHILIGHVTSRDAVHEHMTDYVGRAKWLLPRYELTDKYDDDGLAWYITKETTDKNHHGIEWQIASIPKPLMP